MKSYVLNITVLLLGFVSGYAQESLSELLKKHNTNAVPYVSVQELAMPKTQAIILDAREPSEFQVSHIKNAIHVGYDNFNLKKVQALLQDQNQTIIVYCSLGIRSEDIAEKLQKAGYKNTQNLYGGIFEWKNNNFPVYNTKNQKTDSIHGFSKIWSKWLDNGIIVYN